VILEAGTIKVGSKKEIIIPKPSERLAEFLGIFLGDGGIGNDYQISISFNYKTEQVYAHYVAWLVSTLFGLASAMRVRPKYGCGDIIVNSRSLIEFIWSQGIRSGNKIREGSCLPDWVFEVSETRRGSVRGLFDTDGCIYRHAYRNGVTVYSYPKLALTSYLPKLQKQYFNLLVVLGFSPREYGNRVYLYSQSEVLRYWREIGTHNPWHQGRFEEFCEDLELEERCITNRRGARARLNGAVC
jgi:intein/homing endonuclease